MKKYLRIPNEARFVAAVASAAEPTDTFALLLEIGAIAARDTALVRQIREALEAGCRSISKSYSSLPEPAQDVYIVISDVLAALELPDYQAYLAFRLREPPTNPQAGETLLHALAVIRGAWYPSKHRPWDERPDDHALRVLRAMFVLIFGTGELPALVQTFVTDMPEAHLLADEAG